MNLVYYYDFQLASGAFPKPIENHNQKGYIDNKMI